MTSRPAPAPTDPDRDAGGGAPPRYVSGERVTRITRRTILAVNAISFLGLCGAVAIDLVLGVDWPEFAILGVMYALTGLGITVGYHRHFSHRAFDTSRPVRALLAIFGSMAGGGRLISWVATHRCHHKFSDRAGDPHSPHVPFAPRGRRPTLRGLWHAQVGWLTVAGMPSSFEFARDLIKDPLTARINRAYPVWVVAGLLLPAAAGALLCGGPLGALRGLLWGGLARMFFNFHFTWAINSLTHAFGSRPHATREESTNNAWLALPTLGEAWHNNHHAFPRAATFAHRWWQVDVGYATLWGLERLGLVWNLKRPGRRRRSPHDVRPTIDKRSE